MTGIELPGAPQPGYRLYSANVVDHQYPDRWLMRVWCWARNSDHARSEIEDAMPNRNKFQVLEPKECR